MHAQASFISNFSWICTYDFSIASSFWPTWFSSDRIPPAYYTISSTVPSSNSICCSTDWIPPAVLRLWQQYKHYWASNEHLIHSGQCTFRCSLHHHSVSSEWCWAKQEQCINSAWWDIYTAWVGNVSQYWILLNSITVKADSFIDLQSGYPGCVDNQFLCTTI